MLWGSFGIVHILSLLIGAGIIIGLYFIAPAVLSLFFHIIMKRLGWVKDGDMKLQG